MGWFSTSKSKDAAKLAGPPHQRSGSAQAYGSVEQQAVAGAQPAQSCSTSRSCFEHATLQANQIRVFILHRGRPRDPVHVSLQHRSDDSSPEYTALSFVWGDERRRRDVLVDGRRLSVTETLEIALRGVREEKADLTLWADQICINQKDGDEKIAQINKMSLIYPRARIVLCWLGEDDGSVEKAFAILRRWAGARGEGRSQEKLRAQIAAETVDQVSNANAIRDPLEKLFSRPWWHRAWTLQEVCPSETNQPILISGKHQLDWTTFWHACYTMFRTLNIGERPQAFSLAIEYVLPMLQTSWAAKSNLCLSSLLPIAVKRKAKYPRDKVYALLGMTSAAGYDYPKAENNLSVNQVCIKYTRAIIETDRDLHILVALGRGPLDETLPTWAINLEDPSSASVPMDTHHAYGSRFKATLNLAPMLEPAREALNRVLTLSGLPIDAIDRVYPVERILQVLKSGSLSWDAMIERLDALCRTMGFQERYKPTTVPIVEAILNALTIRDFHLMRQDATSAEQQREALWISYRRHLSQSQTAIARLGPRASGVTRQSLETSAQRLCSFGSPDAARRDAAGGTSLRPDSDAMQWLNQKAVSDLVTFIDGKSNKRSVFVTARGYVGMGPEKASPGDQVCLLFGASTPFVLRPVRTRFGPAHQLLDEAYCEGVMDGEVLKPFVMNGRVKAPTNGWTRYALV